MEKMFESFLSGILKSDEDFTIDGICPCGKHYQRRIQQKKEGCGKVIYADMLTKCDPCSEPEDAGFHRYFCPNNADCPKSRKPFAIAVVANNTVYLLDDAASVIDGWCLSENVKSFRKYARELNDQMFAKHFDAFFRELVARPAPANTDMWLEKARRVVFYHYKQPEHCARGYVLAYGLEIAEEKLDTPDILQTYIVCRDDALQVNTVRVLLGLADADAEYIEGLRHKDNGCAAARSWFYGVDYERQIRELLNRPGLVKNWEMDIANAIRDYITSSGRCRMVDTGVMLTVTFDKDGKRYDLTIEGASFIRHLATGNPLTTISGNIALDCKDIVEIKLVESVIYTRNPA